MKRTNTIYCRAVNRRGRFFIRFKVFRRFAVLDYCLRSAELYASRARSTGWYNVAGENIFARKHRYYIAKFNKYRFFWMKQRRPKY